MAKLKGHRIETCMANAHLAEWIDACAEWKIKSLADRDKIAQLTVALTTANAEADKLRQAARWIPREERLPDDLGMCVLARIDGDAWFKQDESHYDEQFTGEISVANPVFVAGNKFVTHWRPLPEPPDALLATPEQGGDGVKK